MGTMKAKTVKAIIGLVGIPVLLSDFTDIGKFDRFHHWQLGALLILVGLA